MYPVQNLSPNDDLKQNSFEPNIYSPVEHSSFVQNEDSLKPIKKFLKNSNEVLLNSSEEPDESSLSKDKILKLNPICKDDIKTIIVTKPIFAPNFILSNIWKQLIINVDIANIFYPDKTQEYILNKNINDDFSVVISLNYWHEFNTYNALNYAKNVQKAGKLFIYFPLCNEINLLKQNDCHHTITPKSKCPNGPCGILTPLSDMKAMALMINNYMDKNNSGVLLHCYNDRYRMFVFIGCCMIEGGCLFSEVNNIMTILNLPCNYRLYIKEYARFTLRNF